MPIADLLPVNCDTYCFAYFMEIQFSSREISERVSEFSVSLHPSPTPSYLIEEKSSSEVVGNCSKELLKNNHIGPVSIKPKTLPNAS